MAGRRNVPHAANPLVIPAGSIPLTPEPDIESLLNDDEPQPRKTEVELQPRKTVADMSQIPRAYSAERYKDILAEEPARPLRDYAYFMLLFALIPLVVLLMSGEQESFEVRLLRTIENASSEVQVRVSLAIEAIEKGNAQESSLFDALPNNRLDGAHLPRKTFVHWLYALATASVFFVLTFFLAPSSEGNPMVALLTGFFTGTIGILFLFIAQFLAEWSQGHIFVSGNPFLMLMFWIAWGIGFSYRAALDPTSNFFVSFLGYSFGVDFCEEACKAAPVISYYRTAEKPRWRVACTLGFASGVGFGVAEAIMYSANHYNGVASMQLYFVRFVSCVALHAIWSSSSALFIHRYRHVIQADMTWQDFIPRVLFVIAIPMLLHGLYDTALKKEMNMLALVTALASFAWLAWCIEGARSSTEKRVGKVRASYA